MQYIKIFKAGHGTPSHTSIDTVLKRHPWKTKVKLFSEQEKGNKNRFT